MTLAEQWIQEGFQKGIQQGLLEGIVLAIHLKFGVTPKSDRLIELINNIQDLERIKALKQALWKAHNTTELIGIISEENLDRNLNA